MLENIVMGVKGLNNVKYIQQHETVQGNQPLTYLAYLTILLATALP